MKQQKTNRNFRIDEFKDFNGVDCSLQESSASHDEGLIWLGCNEIGLKSFTPGVGWKDIELEQDAHGTSHIANTRMHLSQSQVKELLPALQYFATHGCLPSTEQGPQNLFNRFFGRL